MTSKQPERVVRAHGRRLLLLSCQQQTRLVPTSPLELNWDSRQRKRGEWRLHPGLLGHLKPLCTVQSLQSFNGMLPHIMFEHWFWQRTLEAEWEPDAIFTVEESRDMKLEANGCWSAGVRPAHEHLCLCSVCNGSQALGMLSAHVGCWPSGSMARLAEALRGGQQHATGSGERSQQMPNDRDTALVRGRMLSSTGNEREQPHNSSYMHISSPPKVLSVDFYSLKVLSTQSCTKIQAVNT